MFQLLLDGLLGSLSLGIYWQYKSNKQIEAFNKEILNDIKKRQGGFYKVYINN